MSKRVVIGKRASDGLIGLAVSLSGVDANLADPTGPGFSFSDRMSNVVKVALSGIVTTNSNAPPSNTVSVSHGLGYIPFLEARILSSTTIFDDYVNLGNAQPSNPYSGVPCKIGTSDIVFSNVQTQLLKPPTQPAIYTGYSAYYVVYPISVPS